MVGVYPHILPPYVRTGGREIWARDFTYEILPKNQYPTPIFYMVYKNFLYIFSNLNLFI